MLSDNLHIFFKACIEKAWEFNGLCLPNPAVGAMVLNEKNEILALDSHKIAGGAHAEVLALSNALIKLNPNLKPILDKQTNLDSSFLHEFLLKNHNNLFHNSTLLLTLEPCNHTGKTPPCASLVAALKPKKVIIANKDLWGESSNGAKQLLDSGISVSFLEDLNGTKKILDSSNDLLAPFLKFKNHNRCNIFKIAMRLNANKEGKISSLESRIHTHNQRSVADSIIISSNTLLNDNPILDSRFCVPPFKNSHIPKVQILSRTNLDLTQFNIYKNRNLEDINVAFSVNELNLDSGINIIEGGFKLLEVLKEKIDFLLIYLSPSILESKLDSSLDSSLDLRFLESINLGKERLLWLQL